MTGHPRKDDLRHFPAVLVAAVAACLFFVNLGNVVFWGDEAETAILARNTLDTGLPTAWDGANLVESLGIGMNDDLLWNQQPWLQFYLTAASFAVFGTSTTAARLPFAFAGLLTVILTYVLVRKESESRPQALLAMLFLTANVQFLLYARQCRYHALLALGVVLALLAWRKIDTLRGAITLALASAFLFHSNYLAFFPTFAAFWIAALLWRRDKTTFLHLSLTTVIVVALTLPWAIAAGALASVNQVPHQSFPYWLFKVKTYASKVSRRIVPFSLLACLVPFYLRRRLPDAPLVRIAALILLAHLLFIPFAGPALVLRYALGLFPLGAILLASLIAALYRWRKPVPVLVALLFLATNLFNTLDILIVNIPTMVRGGIAAARNLSPPEDPQTPFLQRASASFLTIIQGAYARIDNRWLREDAPNFFLRTEYARGADDLFHGFPENPNRLMIEFVNDNVEPGELVATGHDWLPLIFYTSARIMGAYEQPPEMRRLKQKLPGYVAEPWNENTFWYINRKGYWVGLLDEILTRASEGTYTIIKFPTDIPDIPHGNDPDLDSRIRTNLDSYPTIDIYRVKKTPAPASQPTDSP